MAVQQAPAALSSLVHPFRVAQAAAIARSLVLVNFAVYRMLAARERPADCSCAVASSFDPNICVPART